MLRAIVNLGRSSLEGFQAVSETWEVVVGRSERKTRKELDEDIQVAGLESLMPDALEQHLLLNGSRLNTFEAIHDGCGLCSPGRWPLDRRRLPQGGLHLGIREIMKTALSDWEKTVLKPMGSDFRGMAMRLAAKHCGAS